MESMIQSVDLMHPLVQVTKFMIFLKMRTKLLLKIQFVLVNTNKTIWEGRVIKITYIDLPHNYNDLKLIWINTKRQDMVLIKIIPGNTNKK